MAGSYLWPLNGTRALNGCRFIVSRKDPTGQLRLECHLPLSRATTVAGEESADEFTQIVCPQGIRWIVIQWTHDSTTVSFPPTRTYRVSTNDLS